jgi:hypothetical protein
VLKVVRGRAETRAPATIRGRLASWDRFLRWAEARALHDVSPRAIRSFLAEGIARRGWKPSYALGVLSNLSTGFRLLRGGSTCAEQQDLDDARDALKRLLPLHPVRQARPASCRQVALLEAADPSENGLLCRLLWHAAARFSDWVGRLPARSVQLLPRRWVQVAYVRTKTSQRGVLRTVTFRLPGPTWRVLERRVERLPSRQAVFQTDYGQFRRWLVSRCPGLTAHSFRRGAIQKMLDAGVSPREICRLTGHKSLETMFGYADRLPPSARREMSKAAVALLG